MSDLHFLKMKTDTLSDYARTTPPPHHVPQMIPGIPIPQFHA
ncbi:hypothetical protein FM102_05655 [Corynebacterium glutamicum]|nr:hypothetical protein FM102_05655 [Corynebacterium glutamicum]